jgi:hypothetical protein
LLQSSEAALKDQLDVLRVQLDTSRSALADEENTTKVLRENLAEIAAEHERTRIREKEERESDKATLLQQKRDLDEATAMVKTLEKNLNAVKIQNRTLVDELNLANQRKSQSDQQVRMLAEDLKKVRTALDAERSRHHANEKSIESLKQIIQRTEQDLRTSVEERNTLNQLLENERKVRALPEETSKSVIEEQKPPGEELRARAEHQARARMQVSSREETAETEEEKGKENIGKDAEIFVTSGSPAQAPVIPATPDAQKSAFSAHGPASFKPAFQITEVSHEAVTDIIDIFSDDESIEDNNLL